MLFFAKKRLNAQAREHVCAGAMAARAVWQRWCAGGNMPVGGAGSMAAVTRGRRGCGACMGNFGNFWEFLRGVWGRHCIPRGFACRWGVGRGCWCAGGVCLPDSNGGAQSAVAWRLCLTCLTCLTNWCATVYPVGLHAAVWFGAGKKNNH